MTRHRPWLRISLAGALSLLLVGTVGCQEAVDLCDRDAVGEVQAWLEGSGHPDSLSFTGEVEEILPPDEFGFHRYRVRDDSDSLRTLVFQAPGESVPVDAGGTYTFRLERVPGMPVPVGLVVEDAAGPLYVAVSDYAPGDRVLVAGIPGWDVRLEGRDCPDVADNPCFSSEVNGVLVFRHDDEIRALGHGETGTLGNHTARCLSARSLSYSGECPDFARFGTVYTLRRDR